MTLPANEYLSKIAHWRQLEAEGKMTQELYIEAIAFMRQGRKAAMTASDAGRRAKAKKEIRSAGELLDELESMGGGE